MDLTALANKSQTDKGTVTGVGHGYSLVYDLLFAGRRPRVKLAIIQKA